MAWCFICLFIWFQDMNPLSHRVQWYGFFPVWLIRSHWVVLGMDSLHLDLSYVLFKIFYVMNPVKLILTNMTLHVLFLFRFPRCILCHTEDNVKDLSQFDYLCVSLGGSWRWVFATQSTEVWIIPSMTIHIPLYMVPEDELLATHITLVWIFTRIYLHM